MQIVNPEDWEFEFWQLELECRPWIAGIGAVLLYGMVFG